ncbi:MAG: hypothetical protein NZM04_00105 [Methylacidiphilales bacterium]|nr:hypothetical protein [Candidatus Methylacidiphilales bacterium]MDW8348852.1 hypothetical protein [Verrucomicrobiae bacterium]
MSNPRSMYRGWKFLLAILMTPLCVAWVFALVKLVQHWWAQDGSSASWFGLLLIGAAGWLIAYLILPKPFWLYVFGHELTHVLAVYMSRGKVYDFKVTSQGGHVRSDRMNWWIALSPYCVPIYTLLWIFLWWCGDFYFSGDLWHSLLFLGIGLTWGFHLTFTLAVLHNQQPDLADQGYIFSLIVILAFNLFFFTLLFVILSKEITATQFLSMLWNESVICYSSVWKFFLTACRWVHSHLLRHNLTS